MTRSFQCGRFRVDLTTPKIMGIVNLTVDSFSGDGLGRDVAAAIEQARRMVEEGADMLDVGAESSRPGAPMVSLEEELARVLPVIRALTDLNVPISVDTVKPDVMRAAIDAGADMINDIRALQEPGAVEAVAGSSAGICLMHMQGTPETMQLNPGYQDVVLEVQRFLRERVLQLTEAGVSVERIVLDPGFGFGKRTEDNLDLLANLQDFTALGQPILVGLSRKSILGVLTRRPVGERVAASVAAAQAAVERGADIVRVHDVAETRDALLVANSIRGKARSRFAPR